MFIDYHSGVHFMELTNYLNVLWENMIVNMTIAQTNPLSLG
jgi:hypothetical protein